MNKNEFCRCCLSRECYKNMCNEYLNGNTKEIYAEMLLNTFDIKISNPERNPCLICDNCITKLRAAAEFKAQVLKAQKTIVYNSNSTDLNVEVKIEIDDSDDFDDKVSDKFSDSDFMWEDKPASENGQVFFITLEPNKRKETKNTPSRPTKKILDGRSKKYEESQLKTCREKSVKKSSDDNKKGGKIISKIEQGKTKSRDPKYEPPPITQTEIDARENTLKLIENSNLCLFRSLKTKFGCFICKSIFVDPSKLREHSSTHTNLAFLKHRISKWRGLSYKNSDISNLKCIKCSAYIQDLTQLMLHLTEKHNIIFNGTNNFLIPYKLSDENQCVLCDLNFNTFLRLSIHMNTHYTNNVCEICGHSFINRLSLRMHMQSMHKEKKCQHCPAKFLTDSSKVAHLKKVHNVFNKKRYCNLCDKTFPYTYLLVKHKIEEHGAKKTIINCPDCGKTFFREANLNVHVRSVHIRERNYPCIVCGSRFFTKCDQKRHENTHNDIRTFSCSYCGAKLKSKDSWRRHMKRQHGHAFT